jgi:hypothetical protein
MRALDARASAAPGIAEPAPEYPKLPVRLRTLLGVAVLATLALTAYPRAVAAWRLHGAATAMADYALCMVGPTGPSSLRDDPEQFRKLARRRLVAAAPVDRPFERCAPLAAELTGSEPIASAHKATASQFVEYGGAATERAARGSKSELALDALAVDARVLAELARVGWPFIRGGYVRLMQGSIGAREAIHPVELPRPAVGHGLPVWRVLYRAARKTDRGILAAFGKGNALSAYRSDDGGLSWKAASIKHPLIGDLAERCGGAEKYFTFATSEDGQALVVRSHDAGSVLLEAALAGRTHRVVASACDAETLIALVQRGEAKGRPAQAVEFVLCRHGGECGTMPQPPAVPTETTLPETDVARVDGVTIVASAAYGIVRVTSTRDDGRTWTPLLPVFDERAHPEVRTQVAVPTRLLALGRRVLLSGGAAKPSQTYPVLISDDYGASFRTPAPEGTSGPIAGVPRPVR